MPIIMMYKRNTKRTALVLALLLCCAAMSGCGLFRSPDPSKGGVGRDTEGVSDTTPDTTTADTTETTETTAPPVDPVKRVSILAVGDNIIHEAVFTDAKKRASDGEEYNFVPMYAGVAEKIAAADIAFINHESPIAGNDKGISGYPTFNSPREAGQALVDVGFDVINLANNHILDKGVAGARATAEYVQSLPVTELGAYLDEEDHSTLRITEVNGIRIAWLSFFDLSILWRTPDMTNIVIPLMDDDAKIQAEIENAKANADFVIVSAHWGREQYEVTAEQKRVAAVMAEAGADVILGHHSHIIQPVEWHENKDGSRTLITYSLGNFLSTQYYSYNMVGGMLTFDILMEDGVCTVENPILNPTVTQYSMNRDSLGIYMLSDYTEELAKAHGTLVHSPDFSLEWIYKHVRSIISDEFLPVYFE